MLGLFVLAMTFIALAMWTGSNPLLGCFATGGGEGREKEGENERDIGKREKESVYVCLCVCERE